jgi:hypothetical protein
MGPIVGASITYRLAFGPNAGLGAPDETADVVDCPRYNGTAHRQQA